MSFALTGWEVAEPKERLQFRSKVEAMEQSADGQRDFDAFVMSAKGETSTRSFQDWAGGEQVTLAIVFTDVVGSTALDYARALQGNTGHPQVRIRAGLARVAADVSRLTLPRRFRWSGLTSAATGLKWERHEGVAMKGFPGKFTLWVVK